MKRPALFLLPNRVWEHYIVADRRTEIICLCCWGYLTTMADGGRYESRYGGPAAWPYGYPLHLQSVRHPARDYMRGIAKAPRVRSSFPAAPAKLKRGFRYTDNKKSIPVPHDYDKTK